MGEQDYKPGGQNQGDDLDRALDAALAKYTAVDPRAGLEERILANLRAERTQVADHWSWRWAVAGALAAAVLVVLALALRPGRPRHPQIANHPASPEQAPQQAPVVAQDNHRAHPHTVPTQRVVHHPAVVAAANPKLEQFPSPEPLSEQEKILASYVTQFQKQAVLVARARAESLRLDHEEEMRDAPPGADDSQRQNDTTDR